MSLPDITTGRRGSPGSMERSDSMMSLPSPIQAYANHSFSTHRNSSSSSMAVRKELLENDGDLEGQDLLTPLKRSSSLKSSSVYKSPFSPSRLNFIKRQVQQKKLGQVMQLLETVLSDEEGLSSTSRHNLQSAIGLLETALPTKGYLMAQRSLDMSTLDDMDSKRQRLKSEDDVRVLDWIQNSYKSHYESDGLTRVGSNGGPGSELERQPSFQTHLSASSNNPRIGKKRQLSMSSLQDEEDEEYEDVTVRERSRRMTKQLQRIHKNKIEVKYSAQEQQMLGVVDDTKVQHILAHVDDWNQFSVLDLEIASKGQPLSVLLDFFFTKFNFYEHFSIPQAVLHRFAVAVEEGYNPNPYHNKTHAADVVHNVYFFVSQPAMQKLVTPRDVLAAIVAAAIHDFKHPGTNNNFHINKKSELALLYNDVSVLENMHVSEAFRLMKNPAMNILGNLDVAAQHEIRETMIRMVLATDMKNSGLHLSHLVSTIDVKKSTQTWFNVESREERLLVLETAIHCADLGNPTKAWQVCEAWTNRVLEEFFAQGDKEKALGLPVSMLCDRDTTLLERSQIGFIQYVVLPLYQVFEELCPVASVMVDGLQRNKGVWLERLAIREAKEAAEKLSVVEEGQEAGEEEAKTTPPSTV